MTSIAGQPPLAITTPFDAIAGEYDARFSNSLIGTAQRASVWTEVDRRFHPGQRILDINCGTGVDALHLASRGIDVVACDASSEMIAAARRRGASPPTPGRVEFRVLANEQLGQLTGPFDGVLSNFAGLNCTADLSAVAWDLARLVRPGGSAILTLFGRTCVWEMLWYAIHGNGQKAFRRLAPNGSQAKMAPGQILLVRYPSRASLCRNFLPHFRLRGLKGVGVAVPPSYVEPWAVRFPRLFRFAARIDPLLGRCPGMRSLADHVVLVLERVE